MTNSTNCVATAAIMLFRSDRKKNSQQALADLNAARRGDARAFSRLVVAHQAQIYSLSYRVLGDEQAAVEAAQSAVSQAARNIAGFQAGHFQLWLLGWVVSACQERLHNTGLAHGAARATAGPSAVQALQDKLCHLPADLRLALVLVDVTGLDYAEAATVLGATREQVSRRVAAARARLIRH
jgi:RNA polymerase sigma-70 factor (ECF subfamily)